MVFYSYCISIAEDYDKFEIKKILHPLSGLAFDSYDDYQNKFTKEPSLFQFITTLNLDKSENWLVKFVFFYSVSFVEPNLELLNGF
jgi:hypothetical protein